MSLNNSLKYQVCRGKCNPECRLAQIPLKQIIFFYHPYLLSKEQMHFQSKFNLHFLFRVKIMIINARIFSVQLDMMFVWLAWSLIMRRNNSLRRMQVIDADSVWPSVPALLRFTDWNRPWMFVEHDSILTYMGYSQTPKIFHYHDWITSDYKGSKKRWEEISVLQTEMLFGVLASFIGVWIGTSFSDFASYAVALVPHDSFLEQWASMLVYRLSDKRILNKWIMNSYQIQLQSFPYWKVSVHRNHWFRKTTINTSRMMSSQQTGKESWKIRIWICSNYIGKPSVNPSKQWNIF